MENKVVSLCRVDRSGSDSVRCVESTQGQRKLDVCWEISLGGTVIVVLTRHKWFFCQCSLAGCTCDPFLLKSVLIEKVKVVHAAFTLSISKIDIDLRPHLGVV